MKLSRFLAISSLLVMASLSVAQGLDIGDKAPKLTVTDWVKGHSVTLGKGNITVVEFWATWCAPCKMSIPHLTELAHKFKGKVNFVGVSISESKPEDYTTKVPAFVKDFGDKMDYNVATEGPGKFMSVNWMQAAKEPGIPTAFLVDKAGNIAWIGHPLDENFPKVIDDVIAGKADLATIKAARTKEKAQQLEESRAQKAQMAKIAPFIKAFQAKKYEDANAEVDKLMISNPEMKPTLCQYKLMSMTKGNLSGMPEYIASLGNEDFAKDPMMLNQIIWTVVEDDLMLSPKTYAACVTLGEKMMNYDPKNAMNMDTYALAIWRSGNKAKALETQKKAVELASNDKSVPVENVTEMKSRLKEYGG
jgi:thiol-disulfide isomerase/thioredoxin